MISELTYVCANYLKIIALVNQCTQFWAKWQLRKGNALNVVPIFLDNFRVSWVVELPVCTLLEGNM